MSAPKAARDRARKLRDAVRAYRAEAHERDRSPISPEALASLKAELAELEAKYPELVTADSPTQVVAGAVLPELSKVRHAVPQWSLNDAFDEEELAQFDERVARGLSKAGGAGARPAYSV